MPVHTVKLIPENVPRAWSKAAPNKTSQRTQNPLRGFCVAEHKRSTFCPLPYGVYIQRACFVANCAEGAQAMNSSADDVPTARDHRKMDVRVSLRHLGLALAAATIFFTTAGAAIVVAKFTYGFDRVYGLYHLFDLGSDSSVPTWYASFALLLCSALLALHAVASHRAGNRRAPYWWLLALIFLLLSVDEVARLHETLGAILGGRWTAHVGDADGLFHWSWVLPGALFAGAVAVLYIRFLFSLPRGARYGMIAAGALFVGGAVFVEMLNAQQASVRGTRSLRYQLGTIFEEFLEMAGIALFAHVLVRHLTRQTGTVSMHICLEDAGHIVRPVRSD